MTPPPMARWAGERFDLLQPDSTSAHVIMAMLVLEMIKAVGTKEVCT